MHNPYEEYYLNQVGQGKSSALPVYSGLPVQRGRGLGNIFGALARSAAPLLKRGAIALGKQLFKTGGRVVSDLVSGNNLKSSLKRRAKESVQDLGASILQETLNNNIKKRKKTSGKKKKSVKKIKRQPDVFD